MAGKVTVTLAMRHRLSGMSTCGLSGLGKGDEHPAYALEYYGILTFAFYLYSPNFSRSYLLGDLLRRSSNSESLTTSNCKKVAATAVQ